MSKWVVMSSVGSDPVEAPQKRKAHNLDSFVLFIDLIKAFDSISREALFEISRGLEVAVVSFCEGWQLVS
jgi:hypothetical protein